MVNLSVVVPAYNESKIILSHMDELSNWLERHVTSEFQIVVVNDGSTDGMGELLENNLENRPWLKVAHHKHNSGRGKAIRTGLSCSDGDYIVCMDADLSYSPEVIPDLLEDLVSGKADITLASTHHPEGEMINVPAQRAALSKWGNRMLGAGFDKKYYTVTCVVRGYTKQAVESLELVSDGKDLHLEVIQKAELLGLHVKEVPAILNWRDKSRGKREDKGIMPEIALFKMRKTVVSHLIFNFITSPGMLLFVPIISLILVVLSSLLMLVSSFFLKLGDGLSLYVALRTTFVDGQLSLLIFLFSTVMLMIFMMFYFLSSQNKRYFDESYTLMMRMNSRIKKLEDKK
ncbi:glycosyltransferase family 2 protein [Vibrio sp. HN007]|uniref:glycosyltransferase family 2 protein n=1 Tax=Vibrio iocasae TaxID=3098914 RepID=UPI0035D46083